MGAHTYAKTMPDHVRLCARAGQRFMLAAVLVVPLLHAGVASATAEPAYYRFDSTRRNMSFGIPRIGLKAARAKRYDAKKLLAQGKVLTHAAVEPFGARPISVPATRPRSAFRQSGRDQRLFDPAARFHICRTVILGRDPDVARCRTGP